jgi:superfamily II DNA or RNA helicase
MKRDLILRNYQIPASDFILKNDKVVLAIAPNGGKTEISIDVLEKILLLNPTWRALILTHSTNILKDNYTERLDGINTNLSYSTTFDKSCQIHICLPNSENKIKGQYEFLIVDEAHENYLAKRVQRIIMKIKPIKQLLLTGTPSKFIKEGGWQIYTIAANQIPKEYFAKLHVELVVSNYNWGKQFNVDNEVKSTYIFDREDTKKTLEAILLKLIDRLKKGFTPEQFNNPSIFTKVKSWAFTYKNLGKTLIVSHSIKQANDINKILVENGVNSVVSNSENDLDSDEIKNFKNNMYDVLVVVDRVRLGYSDDNLYNIIDMSGSHNPNVIYQIFSRALRGTPDKQKYYLKVTTQEYGMMDYTHACVSAALMLTDNKYLSTFNGDNFNGIRIPVIKQNKLLKTRNHSGNGGKNINKTKNFLFPEFTNDVIDMFRNILHNLDEPVSIYKTTTIGEVRGVFTGKNIWTKERILDTIYG